MTVEEKAEEYGQIVAEGTGIIDFKHVSVNAYMDGYNEAMRWRDPKVELPDNNIQVFVKFYSNLEDEYIYTTDHVILDNTGHRRFLRHGENVIGWRPIENKNHFGGRIEEAGCDFCRDEQGYTIFQFHKRCD